MKSTVWVFESMGRQLRIKKDDDDTYWITGSGIGDIYVPLLDMLSGMHGKRKVLKLEREMSRLKSDDDVTGYLQSELGGRLGYALVSKEEVEDNKKE